MAYFQWFMSSILEITLIKSVKGSLLFLLSKEVAVSEFLEVLKQPTDTCEVLGQINERIVSLLDETNPKTGIIVTYSGGDICTNGEPASERGKPRSSRFKIYCSSTQDANVKMSLLN